MKRSLFHLKSFSRLYSSQTATKGKSPLAQLRQRTGFPISKCKEALTKHNENLEAAESWMYSEAQKEGWAKVEKLKDRAAHQGLIGMLLRRNDSGSRAIMVEVNCETDFVARNDKFKTLTASVTQSTFENHPFRVLKDTPLPTVDYLTRDVIGAIAGSNEQTLADKVAESVGHLSENISISRGCSVMSSGGLLCGFVYNNILPPESEVQLGTYATLLHMLPLENSDNDTSTLEHLGQQICQHVVGMDLDDVASGEESTRDLTKLLSKQSFVFDSSVTVGELLAKHGVTITKVVRYALGERDKSL